MNIKYGIKKANAMEMRLFSCLFIRGTHVCMCAGVCFVLISNENVRSWAINLTEFLRVSHISENQVIRGARLICCSGKNVQPSSILFVCGMRIDVKIIQMWLTQQMSHLWHASFDILATCWCLVLPLMACKCIRNSLRNVVFEERNACQYIDIC